MEIEIQENKKSSKLIAHYLTLIRPLYGMHGVLFTAQAYYLPMGLVLEPDPSAPYPMSTLLQPPTPYSPDAG